MSNLTSQTPAATSAKPGTPTEAAGSAAQKPASSAASAAEPTAASSSAAPTSSNYPTSQQPPTSQDAPKAPDTPAPAAAAPTQSNPSNASPPEQKPQPEQKPPPEQKPAPEQKPPSEPSTTTTSRDATPAAGAKPTPAGTSSDTAPPAAATSSKTADPSSVVTVTPGDTSTRVEVITSTTTQLPGAQPKSTSSTSTPTPIDPSTEGASGLSQPSRVAIGVVVPIAAIALLAILGLFWWKKRRARQEAEEERRKEVEDYAYNPKADPPMPSAGHSADNSYEVREDNALGYRGWGSTTAPGSLGRKPSTTMSGGGMVGAYSDPASPTRGNPSEARSGEPLLDGSSSPEGEILGAMEPSAANNRSGDMRRGPSNASSYSVGARSEGSDGGMYGNASNYYEQYGQNPYSDQRPQDPTNQAVIRDNPARRNTRIENSAHYPQQSAGIAQNF